MMLVPGGSDLYALTKNHREHSAVARHGQDGDQRGFRGDVPGGDLYAAGADPDRGRQAGFGARSPFGFQQMMRETYVGIVEEATGRKVRAFLSQNHIGPDLAAEIFVLEQERAKPPTLRPSLRFSCILPG